MKPKSPFTFSETCSQHFSAEIYFRQPFPVEINADTNKAESFYNFAKRLNFGGEILQENDMELQERLIKYNNQAMSICGQRWCKRRGRRPIRKKPV